jgi:beta-xylosidase
MTLISRSLVVASVASGTWAANYSDHSNSTYYNPVLSGWHSDPSCIHVGDTYYCATSTFDAFPGMPIYASKDLINWKHISNTWNREEQLPGINLQTPEQQSGMFAPNLRYHDGFFYVTCVYAGINTTSQINGTIFTTENPFDDTAWSVPFVWEAPYRTIDPDLFWDDDGTAYLTWSGVQQQTIDLSTGTLSNMTSIWNGSTGIHAEGPHIYKKDGYYYLLAAEGGTQLGHTATIARSSKVSGPYESNPANPILGNVNTTGLFQTVGHADLVEDDNGKWWGMALTTRSGPEYSAFPMGREAALFPVTWREGEWPFASQVRGVMNGWKLPAFNRDVPGSGPFNGDPDVVDFTPGSTLPLNFMHFRYPANGTFVVSPTSHPHTLQVLPSRANLTGVQDSLDPDLNGQSGIAFVGRRQTDSLFKFEVDLTFCPENKPGYEAGATMFFTQWQHLDVGIVFKPVTNSNSSAAPSHLVLRTTNATSTETSVPVPAAWSSESVRLTIQAVNTTHYRFSAAPVNDLNSVILLGDVSSEFVSSTWGYQAGSGAAVMVGVYTTTNGEVLGVRDAVASDFAYFSRWRYTGRGQEVDFGTFV